MQADTSQHAVVVLVRFLANCLQHLTHGPPSERGALSPLLANTTSVLLALCRVQSSARDAASRDERLAGLLRSSVELLSELLVQHGAADASLLLALCACTQLVGELVPASPAIVLQVDAALPLLCGWAVAVAGAGAWALGAGTQHAAARAQAGAGSRRQWEQHHPARAAAGSAAGPPTEVQVAALSALLSMTRWPEWVELLRCGHID